MQIQLCGLITLAFFSTLSAQAASITWSIGPSFSGPNGHLTVRSDGSFVTGRNFGEFTVDLTINSNQYTGASLAGNFGTESPGSTDANFNLMIGTFSYTNGGFDLPQTVSGLTIGRNYLLQLFIADGRPCCAGRTSTLSDFLGSTIQITQGDYVSVLGTFTANATSQSWNQSSSQASLYNGWQLRDVTSASNGNVPEPAGFILTAAGLVVVYLRRR